MIFNELRNRSISVCSLDQANNKAMAAKVAGIQPQSMRNSIALQSIPLNNQRNASFKQSAFRRSSLTYAS